MNLVLVSMLAYVLVQFVIGAVASRRMTTEQDYILAGRKLGPSLVTFSVFASFFGAEAVVAAAGSVYDKGLAGAGSTRSATRFRWPSSACSWRFPCGARA